MEDDDLNKATRNVSRANLNTIKYPRGCRTAGNYSGPWDFMDHSAGKERLVVMCQPRGETAARVGVCMRVSVVVECDKQKYNILLRRGIEMARPAIQRG